MQNRKHRRLTRKGKITIAALVLCTIIAGSTIFYFKTRPLIVFYHRAINVEINTAFDPYAQIKKIRQGKMDEVQADTSQIDLKKLGQYQALYHYHDHTYTLKIKVVDTTPPIFETQPGETDCGVPVDPTTLIKNVQDATKTSARLKKKYHFDKEGEMEVTVVVSDESGNESEQNVKVKVLPKDTEAPVITAEKVITLQQGATFNPLESVEIKDNQDPHPAMEMIKNEVDTSKLGSYEVVINGKDRSGNESTFKQTIQIVEKISIGSEKSNGHNIVYLTFDDGPSYNTPKILDILDHYQIKATFFVTGNSPDYNDNILRAYQSGHTIGLHTYSHDYEKIYQSKTAYFKDLNQIGQMVEEIIGFRPHYIRFPGGSSNTVSKNYQKNIMTELSQDVIDRGYQYYDWNVTSSDADGNNIDVDEIISSSTIYDSGNLIILMHDGRGKDTTVEALPQIIEYYQNLGFRFSAITDESYTCHHHINN